MKRKKLCKVLPLLLTLLILSAPAVANAASKDKPEPIVIQEQGSFFAGGTVVTKEGGYDPKDFRNPGGQAAYGDHAYVFYQIPVNARKLPIVFLHGGGESKTSWESTPDGREGFQNIFLRRSFGVCLVDQPRCGEAGSATVPGQIHPQYFSKTLITAFRLGKPLEGASGDILPDFYSGSQFPNDTESLAQFFRQGTPNIGPLDSEVISDAMSAVFDKTGPGIFVTHSMGGSTGWETAVKNKNIRAIVAYEPGGTPFLFPEREVPEPINTSFGLIEAKGIPLEDFKALAKIPIVIYYGDNIAKEPTDDFGQDQWRAELQLARDFAETLNRYGGDATVIHLPEIGIRGNTHFPFSDLNNIEIADLMSQWLKEKGLDG
jgi:pimeloyl-ACP methyl ester carboxylesterase